LLPGIDRFECFSLHPNKKISKTMNKDFSGQAEIFIPFPSGQTSCPVILENIFL